ncbi:MAG: ABC transporter permease [Anaerolineae bacterium]|nr:ABC transporter permease [Anaerolineae bacterium]
MKTRQQSLWAVVLLVVLIAALAAPVLAPYQPLEGDPYQQFLSWRPDHWLGTDHLGRDVFSRVLWGARNSLLSAILATGLASLVGIVIGGIAGGVGGLLDRVLMRGVDVLLAFPALLLALLFVVVFGGGQWQAALAVGLALSVPLCRMVRASVLTVRSEPYLESARAIGAGPIWIIVRHIFPNIVGHVLSHLTVIFAWSLLNMAALDFLGVTGSISTVTWGRMIAEGRPFLRDAPSIALAPGFLLTLTVIAVTGIGDSWKKPSPR